MLTLAQARAILDASFSAAAALGLKPLAVAVLDAGGHVAAVERQDGASTLRAEIAIAKAAGALALGISSRTIAELAVHTPAAIGAVGQIAPHGIAPSLGGAIVVDEAGTVLGAVGASGDTGNNDEACVLAGVAAAELKVLPPLVL